MLNEGGKVNANQSHVTLRVAVDNTQTVNAADTL